MCPEPEEILERAEGHEQTVGEAVEEEEDEVLVVVEGDAVVDPGAVVIHLEHAAPAHRAVVRAVRLHTRALLAVAHRALKGTSFINSNSICLILKCCCCFNFLVPKDALSVVMSVYLN